MYSCGRSLILLKWQNDAGEFRPKLQVTCTRQRLEHKLIISRNLDFEDELPQKGERASKGKISIDNHTLLNKTLTSLHYFGPKRKSIERRSRFVTLPNWKSHLKVYLHYFKLHWSLQFHLILQILVKFSLGPYLTLSKFRKWKGQFLCCVHLLHKAGSWN